MGHISFFTKTNTVVSYAEDEIVFRSLNFQNNLSGPSVFVRVDDRFAQDAIKLRGHLVIFNIDFRFQVQPAGSLPDFSLNQLLERGQKLGGVDLFLVEILRNIARVHNRAVD